MSRKVKSVRVPKELETIDLSGLIHECENYLRDLESAALLKSQGNRDAAESLIKTRERELGRAVGRMVYRARVEFGRKREE